MLSSCPFLSVFFFFFLCSSQILLGIEIFPAFFASFHFVDFTVPDEILGGVKDFGANYAQRLNVLLHGLLEQMFVLLSGVANITNKTI